MSLNINYARDTLIIAVHPYLFCPEIEKRFTPLADYLSKEIGEQVVVRVGLNHEDHISNIGTDKVDIAYMGLAEYVELAEKYRRKPILAGIEKNNSRTFVGKILVRKDSDISSLDELKLENFVFVNRRSTMGYKIPIYMLQKLGKLHLTKYGE